MTKALLIIDVQNAVLDGNPTPERQPVVEAAQAEMVGRLRHVLAAARARRWPVFFVQHGEGPGMPLAVGGRGWQIRQELEPLPNEPVIAKTSCDSFYQTDLEDRLRAAGVDDLVIGGCQTQFCIDTACRRAVSLGFDVTLIADGHMTTDQGKLRFVDIVAHHNEVLSGFNAGRNKIDLVSAGELLA